MIKLTFAKTPYALIRRRRTKLGITIRSTLTLLNVLTCLVWYPSARAADGELARAIRVAAASAPLLEPFSPGDPKYHVFRLNTAVVNHRGNRYSVIRVRIPVAPRQPLVLMFSDIGTIDEYEFVRLLDDQPVRGNLRVIYPRLTDPDHEEDGTFSTRRLLIPHPWDIFEHHVLGIPEALLQPDEEYVLWFRFADARPADVLLAAVFLKPGTQLSELALPAIVGLPELPPR